MSNVIQENQLVIYANQIEGSLVDAARSFLSIGEALVAAKLVLKDDAKFKEWRETQTSVKSQRTASAYMQVYRRFAETKLSGKIGYSVLQELVSAPPEAIEQVERLVEGGNAPTVKETREIVKDVKSPRVLGETEQDKEEKEADGEKEKGDPVPISGREGEKRKVRTTAEVVAESNGGGGAPVIPSWILEEQRLLRLPEEERIAESSEPWHVFGISAYFETMPSSEAIGRLYRSYMDTHEGVADGAANKIKSAYAQIVAEMSVVK